MLATKYLFCTLKKNNSYQKIISNNLMIRSGMIRKTSSGIYLWLPTGLRVLKKIKNIIREEMKKINFIEISMPIIQSFDLWYKSKRLKQYGDDLFQLIDRNKKKFILSPTNEEMITYILKNEIKSYKELPINVFQIQTKFRDEIRPRFGVVRSREFIMKDGYSFHYDSTSLEKTYNYMLDVYSKIFNRLGLKYNIIEASTGTMGGSISHEFQIKSQKIEIAHIFKLDDKYSKIMNFLMSNKFGVYKNIKMGCYGIGITRLIAAIIEQNHDNQGILWPNDIISPFKIAILPINMFKFYEVKKYSEFLYHDLLKQGIEVIIDDRKYNLGFKFKDMELIGIPHFIIISNNNLKKKLVEYKNRKNNFYEKIHLKDINKFINNKVI